jgi:polar amino acid transport system permease protein
MNFDFPVVLAQWPMLLHGVGLTVALTVASAVMGTALGIACAWVRVEGPRWGRAAVGAYVETIRNTPFIIQLFFVFFGLPSLGVKLGPELASVLAMVLNLGAYSCEIVRAGIEATPRGQLEAAQSLAFTRWQTFTRVVLPPALARVWPAQVGQIIIVMLGSAVCGQISVEEVSQAANLISSRTYRTFESYIVVSIIYLALAVAR